jgi:NAD(P)-dependent dehydrogenase (short-subunit alcohol dehydrogenase family)/acyl carrier protein
VSVLDRLCVVTRGSQRCGATDGQPDLAAAPLWAMAGSVANELPRLKVARLDLPAARASGEADLILAVVSDALAEPQLALREGGVLAPRLRPGSGGDVGAAPVRIDGEGTYVVTGGCGGLGLATARWLVAQGARRLVLTGRNPQASPAIEALRAQGAEVDVVALDVADSEGMTSLFDRLRSEGRRVKGVVHAAGVLDDGLLYGQTPERFRDVARPKVDGAWNLHRATRDDELDFFLLYSSTSSVFGAPAQANYAAANGYLDALAHRRIAEGLPATSVNWGPWLEEGMFARLEGAEQDRSTGLGIIPFTQSRALKVLERILAVGAAPQVVACRFDPSTMAANPMLAATASLLSELGASAAAATVGAEPRSTAAPAPAPAPDGPPTLETLREMFARAMGLQPAALDLDQPLLNLGLDSLMAVDLRSEAKSRFGVEIDLASLLDGTSLRQLAAQLAPTAGAAASRPSTGAIPERIDGRAAADLLGRLDELSASEQDALLSRMLSEEEHAG